MDSVYKALSLVAPNGQIKKARVGTQFVCNFLKRGPSILKCVRTDQIGEARMERERTHHILSPWGF